MQSMSRRTLLQSATLGAFAVATNCAPQKAEDAATDLAELDGVATAARIKSGELAASEVLEAALARAEKVEPQINAMTNTYFDMARETEANDGPMTGVPFMVKDLYDWKGTVNTYGSRAFAEHVSQHQSPYMDALLGSGFRAFAKSASPEMGLLASTEPLSNGATRNPWNTDHIPGGSSGGAAAAVAAGVIPVAHATDGGGSIRIPASCCGLFGLKPSRDRQISHGDEDAPVRISINHVVSRSVRDSATVLAATERRDETKVFEPTGLVTGPSTRRLKIGLAIDPVTGVGIDPEVKTATEAVAKLCESLGHEVVEVTQPFDGEEFTNAFLLYWAGGAGLFAKQAAKFKGVEPNPDILEPWTLGLAQYAAQTPKEEHAKAIEYLLGSDKLYASMFPGIDVLLSPTLAKPPLKIGETAPTVDYETLRKRTLDFAAYTPLANAAGAPAMSVPLSWSKDGLPIGAHFSAAHGDEKTLLELAYELEEAQPWRSKKPAVWAG